MKVYAVYSIPKSPEYKYLGAFKTKEEAKEFVKRQKEICENIGSNFNLQKPIYDIQIEDESELPDE